ncbi:unnamed protein product [Meloidogyne enterolobii]|uniref:Uncharacterized protein n=1 Tax=Meloidogyne enterolobii TaxID=390850 RepID=A0ACB0YLL4_MELEN
MFLGCDYKRMYSAVCGIEENDEFVLEFCLQFPHRPKNIEQMKIARYFFHQIFKCAFEYADFLLLIFNPQMIQLLFDANITNIPLKIHSQQANIYIDNEYTESFSKFILNHLISSNIAVNINGINFIEQSRNNLFEILTSGGNRFLSVTYDWIDSRLYNLIIQHIETSNNVSKIVKDIRFYCVVGDLMTSKRAENIENNVRSNNLKSTKYLLSNKYVQEMKFYIYNNEFQEREFYVEIKRIN